MTRSKTEENKLGIRGLAADEVKQLRILAAQAGHTSLNQYLLSVVRERLRKGKP